MNRIFTTFSLMLALLFLSISLLRADTQHLRAVTIEVNNTKIWTPSVFVVNEGDEVELNLAVKIPGATHGFAIDEYKIAETVDEKGKTIKFKANKAGIFPFRCHLHPAHLGGQFVVLKK